ncbi:hypothetical protein PC113_g16517 [Phytophthora cactorum]|uniref:Uncharacterized protein n=1 Tax=Phytophthora cactorum TaxID=29920 RepID=A0A8T0YNF0_9STRA|nr:hypothetical protein PC113_g16517 [Phytophthora cactorum]
MSGTPMGFTVVLKGDKYFVGDVSENTSAWLAGLRKDDQLIRYFLNPPCRRENERVLWGSTTYDKIKAFCEDPERVQNHAVVQISIKTIGDPVWQNHTAWLTRQKRIEAKKNNLHDRDTASTDLRDFVAREDRRLVKAISLDVAESDSSTDKSTTSKRRQSKIATEAASDDDDSNHSDDSGEGKRRTSPVRTKKSPVRTKKTPVSARSSPVRTKTSPVSAQTATSLKRSSAGVNDDVARSAIKNRKLLTEDHASDVVLNATSTVVVRSMLLEEVIEGGDQRLHKLQPSCLTRSTLTEETLVLLMHEFVKIVDGKLELLPVHKMSEVPSRFAWNQPLHPLMCLPILQNDNKNWSMIAIVTTADTATIFEFGTNGQVEGLGFMIGSSLVTEGVQIRAGKYQPITTEIADKGLQLISYLWDHSGDV